MEPQSYVTCGLCQEGPSPIAVSSVRFLGEVDFEMGTGMQGSCSGELLGLKPMGGGREGRGIEKRRKSSCSCLSAETSANPRESSEEGVIFPTCL